MVYESPDKIDAVRESEIEEDDDHNLIHDSHDDYDDTDDSYTTGDNSSEMNLFREGEEPTTEYIEDIVDPSNGFHQTKIIK